MGKIKTPDVTIKMTITKPDDLTKIKNTKIKKATTDKQNEENMA